MVFRQTFLPHEKKQKILIFKYNVTYNSQHLTRQLLLI